jgi:hypothetical protein
MEANLPLRKLITVIAISCAFALAGGTVWSQTTLPGPEQSIVEYQGTVLVVNGVRYPRKSTVSSYEPGNVLVVAQPGKTDLVVLALARFGLQSTLHKAEVDDWFVVVVPDGFESQWAGALRGVLGVASTHLNHRIAPA